MQRKKLSAAIAAMYAAVAQANNLSPEQVREDFSVAPAAVQRMYDEIGKSSELLKQINISGKVEKVGDVIGLSTGLIGSNTDTSDDNTERKPRSIHSLSKRSYKLEKTNFDVRLRYDEIDQWAHVSSDFPARINRKIAESIAISLITVGMNGTSRAANSNFTQNQLLQDVAKGWLQKMREENAARVLGKTNEKVKYGPGAPEYKNLDAVVTDVLNELMDERFADRTDFVVLASRRTVGDKYLRIVNASGDNGLKTPSAKTRYCMC